jgi:3-hydroxyacyl-CoA dehydrogenase / enoyl-CoA hydratase / 3-hydroxybutyryl-CoA epimerase
MLQQVNEMQEFKHFRIEESAAGIVWLLIDVAKSGTNTLSKEVLEELNAVLDALIELKPKGVAIRSAKSSGFIAGADVKEFTHIETPDDALELIRCGQRLMDRIEALDFPTVAVIAGFCLGGGLELSLACDYRIALDDPKTRLGLPEIKLGIHPGFGGTVRAIRLLGVPAAMDLMLTGRTLAARQAKKIGLVDYAVPERLLQSAAEQILTEESALRRPKASLRWLNSAPLRPVVAGQIRKKVAKAANPDHYPAPYALIDLWQKYGGAPRRMLEQEALSVARLTTTDTARNLLRVFLLQNRLKSIADPSSIDVKHVHVVGAGVMGGDIAAWCALQGFQVTVQDTNRSGLASTMRRAHGLFKKRFRGQPHRVTAAMDRLTADEKGCGVAHADVIIEAIFENAEAKQALYRELEPKIKPDALLATNTSSIRLETLAEALEKPERLVGLHFFNPVAKMPLVEVVKSDLCDEATALHAAAFARRIDKLPAIVKSAPGFLVNRVLMPYLLEAVVMAEEGIPNPVIDRAATAFGMPMGPLQLADTVGLDVCLFVADILAQELGATVPEKLRTLVADGQLGVKSGAGFYRYKNGKPATEPATKGSYDTGALQERLIGRLIDEAALCLEDGVVEDADILDAAIIFGTGFAPFRGGPVHYRKQVSGNRNRNG